MSSALELQKYVNQRVVLSFQGGRQVTGTLKGFDQLVNLVLEDATEVLAKDKSGAARKLGTIMAKGTAVTLLTPEEGYGAIANPFVVSDD